MLKTFNQFNRRAMPRLHLPESDACSWQEMQRSGDVVTEILESAQHADLTIMATEAGTAPSMRYEAA